jgi:hypothetical protein
MHFSLAQITNGDPEAFYFLKCWGDFLRAVDDIVDEGKWEAENLFHAFALGNRLYSSNFYRKHPELQMVILTGTAIWEVSCEWEKQPELWKRQWADYMRHSDVAMLSGVAMICSSWKMATTFIRGFLCGAYVDHADRHGVPT